MDLFFSKIIEKIKGNTAIGRVYTADILLSFHYYLLIYINSSFLSKFFSPQQVSVLYIIGSVFTLIILINISKILEAIGNYRLIRYLIITEIVATVGLSFSVSHTLIGLYFIAYLISIPTLYFCFDLLLEDTTEDESKTGEIRTLYLTLGNITIILATLLVAWVLTDGDYYKIYLLSLIFLVPLYFLVKKYFSHFTDGVPSHINIRGIIKTYLKNTDIYNVSNAHLFLQIFYAYMVVYMPIYLSQYIGMSWAEIGLIFTIMLLPFIFVEIPAGFLADKKWGEKEMMTIGFVIIGIFTLCIPFITGNNFFLWAGVLFMTRIGAALVEAMTDSYFFKRVNKNDTDTISFYRMSNPASYIIAPIVATLSLTFLSYHNIFIVLGIIMVLGCHYSLSLQDTK